MNQLREDIKKEISNLKESINYCLDFFLKAFDEKSDYYENNDDELIWFGINSIKDVKTLANGTQRFLKGLRKLRTSMVKK